MIHGFGVLRVKVSSPTGRCRSSSGTYLRTFPEMTMTELRNDDTAPQVELEVERQLELAGVRPPLPSYQRDELPRRLRGDWPGESEGPATRAPDLSRMSNTEERQSWRRHRTE
jgi:hypothetical protein